MPRYRSNIYLKNLGIPIVVQVVIAMARKNSDNDMGAVLDGVATETICVMLESRIKRP
jgi:hypothetical protein